MTCNGLLTGDSGAENPYFSYFHILLRGGQTIPSTNLVNYICTVFTILEFVDDLIANSGLPVRKAAEHVLIHCFQSFETFACTTHEAITRRIGCRWGENI